MEREGGTFAHQIDPYVKEYEQSQFLGPNSLCLSRQLGAQNAQLVVQLMLLEKNAITENLTAVLCVNHILAVL